MNRKRLFRLRATLLLTCGGLLSGLPGHAPGSTGYPGMDDSFPFAPAAGQAGSTAIDRQDPGIVAWASGYSDLSYGAAVDATWQTPGKALGPATGSAFDILCLGRGGRVTLTFSRAITDGAGPDFAIFENSFGDTFLELAWVEVSTDGEHFVRFPNFSFTPAAVGSFGNVDPTQVHGYGGKYRLGFGTPFDLSELAAAHTAILDGTDHFSAEYEQAFLDNFPHLDLEEINFVRLIDIPGDGSALDAEGEVIYDPYPTTGSAGFDLEAVGVLHELAPSGLEQTIDFPAIPHQLLSDGGLALEASATSGLAVDFELLEGPASLSGSSLTFTGLGTVVVQASQPGDGTYGPAVPVTRSFVVADALQHIYLAPVSNQLTGAVDVPLYAESSSGLPVSLFIDEGPVDALVSELGHRFSSGPQAGTVRLRASQAGGERDGVTYAPAESVVTGFEIVAAGDPAAPLGFGDWQTQNGLAGPAGQDSDGDGASDFAEYVGGTDPRDAAERPVYGFAADDAAFTLELTLNGRAPVRVRVEATTDLSSPANWAPVVPEIEELTHSAPGEPPRRSLRVRVPRDGARQFWRFAFETP